MYDERIETMKELFKGVNIDDFEGSEEKHYFKKQQDSLKAKKAMLESKLETTGNLTEPEDHALYCTIPESLAWINKYANLSIFSKLSRFKGVNQNGEDTYTAFKDFDSMVGDREFETRKFLRRVKPGKYMLCDNYRPPNASGFVKSTQPSRNIFIKVRTTHNNQTGEPMRVEQIFKLITVEGQSKYELLYEKAWDL